MVSVLRTAANYFHKRKRDNFQLKVHYVMNEAYCFNLWLCDHYWRQRLWRCLSCPSSSCHVSELLMISNQIWFRLGARADYWRKREIWNSVVKWKPRVQIVKTSFSGRVMIVQSLLMVFNYFLKSKTSYLHIRRYNQESHRRRMLSSKLLSELLEIWRQLALTTVKLVKNNVSPDSVSGIRLSPSCASFQLSLSFRSVVSQWVRGC